MFSFHVRYPIINAVDYLWPTEPVDPDWEPMTDEEWAEIGLRIQRIRLLLVLLEILKKRVRTWEEICAHSRGTRWMRNTA